MLELREKYENLLTQCKVEQDVTLKEATAEKDRVTKDLNNTIEDISRAHEVNIYFVCVFYDHCYGVGQ